MCLILLVLLAFTAFFGRPAIVALLSGVAFLGFLYLRARQIALGVYVTRIVPSASLEHSDVTAVLEIRNTSPFKADSLILVDHFNGSREFRRLIPISPPLKPGEIRKLPCIWQCDAGMGAYHFGPTSALIGDPFGIFQFTMTQTQSDNIEVLPKTIALHDFELPASLSSSGSGLRESPIAGNSVNVLGVRDYVKGDPITRIHWRLSARHGSLVVKELENSVSTDVTLFVDMDQRNHIGLKDESSWEYAKDLAISLIHENLARSFPIQLSSQGIHVPFGRGVEHGQWLVEKVTALKPMQGASSEEEILNMAENIPFGSSLIYVGPLYQNDDARLLSAFGLLRERAVSISAAFIDASTFGRRVLDDPMLATYFNRQKDEAKLMHDRILQACLHLEIPTYALRKGLPIVESMANPRSAAI